MKTVGIFEAKTKLSELCREVAETGEPILIQRRGKPIAQIGPPVSKRKEGGHRRGILDRVEETEARYGQLSDEPDFPDVWKMRDDWDRNPLTDYWKERRPWEKE